MATPQEEIDAIWVKYRQSLTSLANALEENDALKQELAVNFTMPGDIAEIEKRVEEKLTKVNG